MSRKFRFPFRFPICLCRDPRRTAAAVLGLAWTAALAGAAVPAAAQPPEASGGDAVCEEPRPAPAAGTEVVVLPGQRAFIDPATGRPLTPPPAERRTLILDPVLERALSTSAAGLVDERLPDGTHVLRLQGRFLSPLFGALAGDASTPGGPRMVTGHGWVPAPSPAAPEPAAPGGGEGGGDAAP
jgi:hypothetical protein